MPPAVSIGQVSDEELTNSRSPSKKIVRKDQ